MLRCRAATAAAWKACTKVSRAQPAKRRRSSVVGRRPKARTVWVGHFVRPKAPVKAGAFCFCSDLGSFPIDVHPSQTRAGDLGETGWNGERGLGGHSRCGYWARLPSVGRLSQPEGFDSPVLLTTVQPKWEAVAVVISRRVLTGINARRSLKVLGKRAETQAPKVTKPR